MSTSAALARRLSRQTELGAPIALVTVVSTEGSAYRRSGAWMTVEADGTRDGLVSGGCLEADIVLRSQSALDNGRAELAVYDTRGAADLLWGFGVGCQGIVRLVIEPLSGDRLLRMARFFETVAELREDAMLVTRLPGVAPSRGVERALVTGSSTLETSPGQIPAEALAWARGSLQSGEAPRLQILDGVEFSLTPAAPRIRLLLCGAGDDALPLVRLAAELDWVTIVADHRPDRAVAERFPGARVELVANPAELAKRLGPLDARTAAVVMTHNLERDVAWAAALLPEDLGYLGFLGPKRRGEQIVGTARPLLPAPPRARRILAPVGFDTAAETPSEIAVAIVAEISAVLAGRRGEPLSDRDGPIHAAPARVVRRVP